MPAFVDFMPATVQKERILWSKVLAEGDEESLSFFEGQVRSSKPQFAEVDRIETEVYTGAVMLLESYAVIHTTVLLNKAILLLSDK